MISPRYTRGYIILLTLVFTGIFVTVSTAFVGYLMSYGKSERVSVAATEALMIAEGALERAGVQINLNPLYTGETDTALGNGTFTIAVTPIDSTTKRITATGFVPNSTSPMAKKTVAATIGINDSVVSFRYGIQSGAGGFLMENNSAIRGNVYSGGSVVGSGSNMIYGDVVSAGSAGLVYGIHATSSVYAHTIGKTGTPTTIDKNAYYTTKINTTVTGTSFPGSADQPIAPLPITDAQIADWENQAAAGGTVTCSGGTYSISSGSVTLGPKKIPCDLRVSGNSTLTVAGHLWVTGNITFENNALIKMSSALGASNVAIIADKPSDQINSSTITVKNNAAFQNSGTAGSFVFLISQNKSAESGGSVTAISLTNNTISMVAYAAHGLIPLENNINLKEVTAYKISMKNNAVVTYDTGLPSTVFDSGPGGSWSFTPGSYAITD